MAMAMAMAMAMTAARPHQAREMKMDQRVLRSGRSKQKVPRRASAR
jgi:hypothetical protein